MKLRIQGDSLRLRLTQTEVQSVGEGKPVRESMAIGGRYEELVYSLGVHADNSLKVVCHENEISVRIPQQQAARWASSDQVSIDEHITLSRERSLHVLIEKDFRCLHRDAEEEPDQFPNPVASESDD